MLQTARIQLAQSMFQVTLPNMPRLSKIHSPYINTVLVKSNLVPRASQKPLRTGDVLISSQTILNTNKMGPDKYHKENIYSSL